MEFTIGFSDFDLVSPSEASKRSLRELQDFLFRFPFFALALPLLGPWFSHRLCPRSRPQECLGNTGFRLSVSGVLVSIGHAHTPEVVPSLLSRHRARTCEVDDCRKVSGRCTTCTEATSHVFEIRAASLCDPVARQPCGFMEIVIGQQSGEARVRQSGGQLCILQGIQETSFS